MHEEIQEQVSGLHGIFESAIRKGDHQGIFRIDIAAMLIGWKFMSFGMATFVGCMLELPHVITLQQGLCLVARVLDSIKNR